MIRRTPLRKISPQGEENNRLHRLLKYAAILRDGYRCIRCGDPPSPWKPVDCAHIHPKGKYESMRFLLENVFLLCRDCHDWFDGREWNHDFTESDEFVRRVIPKDRYEYLQQRLMYPQPIDRRADEILLKQQIGLLRRTHSYS